VNVAPAPPPPTSKRHRGRVCWERRGSRSAQDTTTPFQSPPPPLRPVQIRYLTLFVNNRPILLMKYKLASREREREKERPLHRFSRQGWLKQVEPFSRMRNTVVIGSEATHLLWWSIALTRLTSL